MRPRFEIDFWGAWDSRTVGMAGARMLAGTPLAGYTPCFVEELQWADSSSPFFLLDRTSPGMQGNATQAMGWQAAIERTVEGLGYELVDVERSAGGLLRVTIDRMPGRTYPSGGGEQVTVDDCEAVTRQLQYLLEVESVDYARLEVSSPGLDRPLTRAADWARFAGSQIDLTLREPFQGRKKWRGVLAAREGGWRVVFREPGRDEQALDFTLDEVREARLVPVIDFKRRRGPGATPTQARENEQ
jgi:ribosome maturation factor RimP